MNKLIDRFRQMVKGMVTGFDRVVFKGSILPLAHEEGAMDFCRRRGVLNKDYKGWMMSQTKALEEAVQRFAEKQSGQGIMPLKTWRDDKDKLARKRQESEGIEAGLIGVWSCVESGRSYRARYCARAGYPQLRHYPTPCKHLYLYFDHEKYGWMNVRLQTWFPYPIQVCMNGREWLRRRLQSRGIKFVRQGNKFFHIEGGYRQAQQFLDEQLNRQWARLLDGFLPVVFPTMRQTLGEHLRYYWTLWQSEWATDLLFRSAEELRAVMDPLLRHALISGTGTRVLRYLDRPVTAAGKPHRRSNNEVISRLFDFHDGIRIRHWVDSNSVKAYNEQNVLRVETTINRPGMFRVHRRAQGEPAHAPKKLRPLRKGVADVAIRTQVSQEINNRYMDELATFSNETPLGQFLSELTRASTTHGRRIRGLDATGKDRELLHALSDPVLSVSGITNAWLRQRLRSTAWGAGRTPQQLSSRITRHLRLLRDHGLIRKITHRRRYHLTAKGSQFVTALVAALAASTKQLMEITA